MIVSDYGALSAPKLTPELLALIHSGDVYSLAVSYSPGMLAPGPMVSYTISPHLRHGDLTNIRPASAAAEVISMSAHVGTHIDALCHIGEFQEESGTIRLYNGIDETIAAPQSHQGQPHLDISQMPLKS